jgi:subtilase family serine protease
VRSVMLRFLFVAALVPLLAGCFGGGGGSKEGQAALTTTTTTTISAPGKEPRDVGGTPAKPAAKASHPSGVGRQAKLHRRNVCPRRGKSRVVQCTSQVATDKSGTPLTFPKPDAYSLPGINGTVWGFGPKDYHMAYNLPWNAKVQQTIGIVMWGDDPTVKKDLDAFDSAFGLGSFPTCASLATWAPCFAKVNTRGLTSPLPTVDKHTTIETSIDVQYAHAMCLNCRIILVEVDGYTDVDPDTGDTYFTATTDNLIAAENMAYKLGATEINNSYGAPETDDTGAVNPECQKELSSSAFNRPGIAIVASSGDSGYGGSCPADLNTVVAVGGTDLWENADLSYSYETVYDVEDLFGNVLSAPGSGCSALTGARSFQTSTANWSQTGCSGKRGIADVSASYGGAWVYDSSAGYNNNPLNPEATGNSYWYVAYGTSLAGPIIAGTYGLAGNGWSVSYPAQIAYQHPTSLHDVITGSNGYCGTIMCQATRGYDGPTGMGTPNGLGGF